MIKNKIFFSLLSFCFIFFSSHAGDVERGKKLFKKCAACHNIAAGANHKTGPKLWNIYGMKAGIQEEYKYSDWLKNSGIVWNDESLAAWIAKKKTRTAYFGEDVKKSKMIFAGLKKENQINDIIAYLKFLK